MDNIREANKLYTYTILFILLISVLGISSGNYIISLLISQLSMVIPAAAYLYPRRSHVKQCLGIGKVRPLHVVVAVVMGLSIIPFMSMINLISMQFVTNVTDSKVESVAEKYPMWVLLIMVALLPALVEEFIYRGIYFGVYKKAGILKGAIVSALLFGLMHGNLNQFAYAVVAGFLFAMITYAGGNVIYTIIMHVVINGTSVVSMYAGRELRRFTALFSVKEEYSSVLEIVKDLGLEAFSGLIITAVGYMILSKYGNNKRNTPDSVGENYEKRNTIKACRIENGFGSTAKNRVLSAVSGNENRIMDATLAMGVVIMVINLIANEILNG